LADLLDPALLSLDDARDRIAALRERALVDTIDDDVDDDETTDGPTT